MTRLVGEVEVPNPEIAVSFDTPETPEDGDSTKTPHSVHVCHHGNSYIPQ